MGSKISDKKTHQQARQLRHNLTQAEARLWAHIRAHQIGDVHFRRQYAIGKYIVEFCAPRRKLIIEIDGSQHLANEKLDNERTSYLNSKGHKVLRFWYHDVMTDLDNVVRRIEIALIESENIE
jgi:very-short-patch-repair endonuclease